MRKLLTLCALLSLTACAKTVPIVTTPVASCASLVPNDWAQGVEAAPIPTDTPVTVGQPLTEALRAAIIAPWASGYVDMSGRLEKANGRTGDALWIMKQCEEKVNAARADRQ